MPVYVDDSHRRPNTGHKARLVADTDAELEAFARIINVKRMWRRNNYYIVQPGQRQKAIAHGAKGIPFYECDRHLLSK